MARTIPGFGDSVRFSDKLLPLLRRERRAKKAVQKAEVVIPKAERHIARDMDEFEAIEGEVLARLRADLNGATPVLDYSIPHQQHYVVLVGETGSEVRSRVLSQTTIAYDYAKEVGAPGTLAGK